MISQRALHPPLGNISLDTAFAMVGSPQEEICFLGWGDTTGWVGPGRVNGGPEVSPRRQISLKSLTLLNLWAQNHRKTLSCSTLDLKIIENHYVFKHLNSKSWKHIEFLYIWAQNHWKTLSFSIFKLTFTKNPYVFQHLSSKCWTYGPTSGVHPPEETD